MNIEDQLEVIAKGLREETARAATLQALSHELEGGFQLVGLAELLLRPQVPTDWVLDGVLAAGTISAVVAKPKVGKSTFARGLCLAVAKGTEFIGRTTRQGPCIYLALEERVEEVTSDFRAMGADGSEPIKIHAVAAPEAAVGHLVCLAEQHRPTLIVVDPLFRILRVRDEKAYAEVYAALGPLIDVARSTGTHIQFTHHSGKALRGDAIDSPLGSTAIGGAVSSLVVLKRTEDRRTIQTVQRVGQDVPETVLTFDSTTKLLSVGGTRLEADRNECEEQIIEFLTTSESEKTEPEIDGHVEGSTVVKRKALRSLFEKGMVKRAGSGKKGDPFKYSFACSNSIGRTSKQEFLDGPQLPVNNGQMLVRQNVPEQMDVSATVTSPNNSFFELEV